MSRTPQTQEQHKPDPARSSPSELDMEPAPESDHQAPYTPFSRRSSPPEPFPELDDDLDSELADLSPAFAHEINTQTPLGLLALPEPATSAERHTKAGLIPQAEEGNLFSSEYMREASQRGLEWARLMFGKGLNEDGAKGNDGDEREKGKQQSRWHS